MLKSLMPISMRKALLGFHQRYVFRKALRKLLSLNRFDSIDDHLIQSLVYGWGNQGFSAKKDYLKEIINRTKNVNGCILECGSGLSTIIMGVIARANNFKVYSLENNSDWYQKVLSVCKEYGLVNSILLYAPLREYSGYDWYDIHDVKSIDDFGLVICDGPPAQTKGGRFGLIPLLKQQIRRDAIILVDDTKRQAENDMIKDWSKVISFDVEYKTKGDQYAVLRLKM